jgi:hypothetical protein
MASALDDRSLDTLLHEQLLVRGDEIVAAMIRAELLPRVALGLVKGSVLRCLAKDRVLVQPDDVRVAGELSDFRTTLPAGGHGLLLDADALGALVDQCVRTVVLRLQTCGLAVDPARTPRFTAASLAALRERCEAHMRGFVAALGTRATAPAFNREMSRVLGDSFYGLHDGGYRESV